MFASHLPFMIPAIATAYIVAIYCLLMLLERMKQYRRP